ncbi:D-alanine--D-alanine ligase family protein [Micropruina sonneratiae]|uniref:D-alanine--D-alanine ligase family protein n=1 Tax=Micropruina sonneratiae TaxID=2986940 RepID=UPI0022278E7A|nr:D-alanine--D-alanine ligase family protein [Micropruina sp. KQZ13P-5]MCW3157898.1 D-alanine--D-alanine ligase [Micropruina sp. KQZ13P-5]
MPQRTRVGIVFGGTSPEHDVSCLTAGGVGRAIDADRFEVVGIGITPSGRWVQIDADEVRALRKQGETLPRLGESRSTAVLLPGTDGGGRIASLEGDRLVDVRDFDVAFTLLHGPFGEDGTIQGMFEMLGIRYVGSGVAASANGMDKDLMKRTLSSAGLPGCRFATITARQWEQEREASLARIVTLGLPLFVKPARGGSSVGITRIDSLDDLDDAVALAHTFDPKLVVEEGVLGAREVEFAVLGGRGGAPRVSLPGEIVLRDPDTFYDFEAKYVSDDDAVLKVPTEMDDELRRRAADVAARTFEAMDAEGLARVDLFLTADRRVLVNEINTMPGFTHISMFPALWAATGIDYTTLITDLIEQALERPLGLR